MNLETLNQFNKREFGRLFGLYIKHQKLSLNVTSEKIAKDTGLTLKEVKMIESGRKRLSQNDFETLVNVMQLDRTEILNLSKITHVENILNFLREIDGFLQR
jgi:transcriptional regulator with XRE-family HTH domain